MAERLGRSLDGDHVLLPSFQHCLPALERGDSAQVVEDSRQWCRQGLMSLLAPQDLERLLREGASLWTVLVLPTAPYGFLVAAARYTEYLSILDNALVDRDRLGRDPVYADSLKAAIDVLFDGGLLDESADEDMAMWLKPLCDCLSTLRGYVNDEVWARLHHEVGRFLVGCVEEVLYRNSRTVYDFDTYLRMRRASVGMGMYFALGEVLVPAAATGALSASPYKEKLLTYALDHIALANDLYSFRAEAEADDVVNAVATLMLSEKLSVQAAFDRVGSEVLRNEADFRQTLHETTAALGADHAVSRYGGLLWHMMCGNVDWSFRTTRYNGEGHQWDGQYPQVVQFFKGRTRFTERTYRDLIVDGLV